jgi:hypothetical protein
LFEFSPPRWVALATLAAPRSRPWPADATFMLATGKTQAMNLPDHGVARDTKLEPDRGSA